MSAFPNPGLTPPRGGQWFSQPGQAGSWFPGAPQFNASLSSMLGSFNSLDPELGQLESSLGAYGGSEQKSILQGGRVGTTNAADKLAAMYGTSDPSLASGLAEPGGSAGGIDKYAADRMGLSQIMAQAQGQASQVPGQVAQAQQQVANQYRQNQMKSLKQIIDTISNAAGGQYGYQQAQLGADQGQIALANAQSREQAQNLSSMMNLILNGPLGWAENQFSATGSGGGLGFDSQMTNLAGSSPSGDVGTGAFLQTMGMA